MPKNKSPDFSFRLGKGRKDGPKQKPSRRASGSANTSGPTDIHRPATIPEDTSSVMRTANDSDIKFRGTTRTAHNTVSEIGVKAASGVTGRQRAARSGADDARATRSSLNDATQGHFVTPTKEEPLRIADNPPKRLSNIPRPTPLGSNHVPGNKDNRNNWKKRCCYDPETKTCCGRSCRDWLYIIFYSIIYLIFLSTYTLVFLYISLLFIKATEDFVATEKRGVISTYDNSDVIGLTALPSSGDTYPLIWYQKDDEAQYGQYVKALDAVVGPGKRRRKRDVSSDLGPCGTHPYGYGDEPCVLLKINKEMGWAGKPLALNSTAAALAPKRVKAWMSSGRQMLWLHCDGRYPWDREHIGEIKYYPDPPGFDPRLFPMNMSHPHPLIGVQISKFTLGMSLVVECKLWHSGGPSVTRFILFVAPKSHRRRLNTTHFS